MQNTISVRLQQAYKTEADWESSDPTAKKGEIMVSSDKNGMFKIGNGTSKWSELSYNSANYASSAGSVAWRNVSGKPSSMPASDVYAWAKASAKPSYSWGEIAGKPSTFTPSSHTHTKSQITDFPTLGTAASKNTRTLTSASHSSWANASTDQGYVPDMAFIAYWNGAFSSNGASNLAYCNRGAFGTIVTKNAGDYAAAGHTHNYAGSSSAGGVANSTNAVVGHTSGEGFEFGYKYTQIITIPKTTAVTTYYVKIAEKANFRFKNYYIKTVGNNTQYSFKAEISAQSYMNPHAIIHAQKYNQPEIKYIKFYKVNENFTHDIYLVIDSSTQNTKTINIYSDNSILNTLTTTAPTATEELSVSIDYDDFIYSSKKIRCSNVIGNASTATKATQDSAGQQINTTYIKTISASGRTVTFTRGDGTTGTFTTQDTNTTYSAATTSSAGLMSAADKSKLDGIASGANKFTYTHPSYTARSSGLYKITVDSTGHVSAVTSVAKSDITALGIPGSDTNTWRPLGTTADTACAGNDSRLSNSRPASDVYSWAKASSKPSYSWSEITGKPSAFTPSSHTHDYLPLSGGTITGQITVNSGVIIKNAGLELSYTTPFIDFHFNNSDADYTSRIVENASGKLNINGVVLGSSGAGTLWGTGISINGSGAFSSGITSGDESRFWLSSSGYSDPLPSTTCPLKVSGIAAATRFYVVGRSSTWLSGAQPGGAGFECVNDKNDGALIPGWRIRNQSGAWVGGSYNLDKAFHLYYAKAERLSGNTENGADADFVFYASTGQFAAKSVAQTSDERRKSVISSSILNSYKNFFMKIKPFSFKWKDNQEDTLTHLGVGAQTIYQTALDCGFKDDDIGFVQKGKEYPGTSIPWSVSYSELIPLNIAVTQDHETRISELERENAELKQKIELLSKELAS